MAVTYTLLAVLVLLWVRNELTHRWQKRAIDEASELAREAINRGDMGWRRFYEALPSYHSELFDLTQWSYRSPFAAKE